MTVFLGCLVGVVVVAQTLYTSTMEHIKEFATVKAIGGGNAEIYRVIAKQAAIAAVVGFALGAGMAYGLRPVMAGIDLKLILTPSLSAAVFAGTLALCLGASAISFRRVASLDPALVFRGLSAIAAGTPRTPRRAPDRGRRRRAEKCLINFMISRFAFSAMFPEVGR